ncbi:MAG: YncE family protein [bacterium]
MKFHRELFDYTPSEKITVMLHDFNDFGNAGADAVPRNNIVVGIAPYRYVYETSPANERMNSTMNHELAHVVAMDKANSVDGFFRKVFWGKVAITPDNPISMFYSFLTTPRRYSPRWYHEGLAVFLETWMAGGLGRALGAYDEMVFRTLVRDQGRIYDLVGLESEGVKIDFQVGVNSYLYGTRFMSYLAYEFGPKSLIQWAARTNGSRGYFASQFKKTYGLSLNDAWAQWIRWENQFQQSNLKAIRTNPTTPIREILNQALGSVSQAFYDSSTAKVYTAMRYPGQIASIVEIDFTSGRTQKICDIKGPALYYVASLTYDPQNATIFYTTDNNDWRDLRSMNVKTHRGKTLLKDVRTGDIVFNQADGSIWGVRHYNGLSTIVRIPHPYKEWNQIYSWPYGQDVYDLAISPDGKLLTVSLIDVSGKQKLILLEISKLMSGDASFKVLFDFEHNSPENFVFSPNGKYLYGTSYYSGVSNVFRFDLAENDLSVISNCETGFFRPVPVSQDSLLVFRYTSKGFVPVMIASTPIENVSAIKFLGQETIDKHPLVKNWMAGTPTSVNIDSLTIYSGAYHGLANIGLASAYPVVEGYKDFAALGMRFNFSGPVGLHNLALTASYSIDNDSPDDEKLHLQLSYDYLNWEISARYNASNFYDLFGPTKSSRKGYSLSLRYKKSLLYDGPKRMGYTVHLAGFGNLETLPDFQNISAPFDKFLTFNVNYYYQDIRKSLGAVDDEKGFKWQIVANNNYVNKKLFPRAFTTLDLGVPLPFGHSSIWLRSAVGQSASKRSDRLVQFGQFFFGGFGNNWVDHLGEKRYREHYSFPGLELNEVGGTNFGKFMLEWNLPPLRFRRVGSPSLYATWLRTTLFASGLTTNFDDKSVRRELFNFGGQIDVRFSMLSHLKATLSFGYAAAIERHQDVSKEFMVSLKIL